MPQALYQGAPQEMLVALLQSGTVDSVVDTAEGLIDLTDSHFQFVCRVYFRSRNVEKMHYCYAWLPEGFHEGRILGSSAPGGWLAGC